jgi:ribose 5-phosphate isomerase B
MKLLKKENINEAAKLLLDGAVVAFATETVYGLAVIYDNKDAFDKLVKVKKRNPDKPFSMMLSDLRYVYDYADMNTNSIVLANAFMPGEITLIIDAKKLPEWDTLGTGRVGVRIPNDDFVRDLIRKVGKPLLVTSANKSGFSPLKKYEEVKNEFANDIDAIVYGECVSNMPSTIVDTCDNIKVLRVGSISSELVFKELEKKMKIVVGCDHGGLELKNAIKEHLEKIGHEVIDVGTYTKDSVHYPIYGEAAARKVADHEVDFGIVVCTSGEGIMIAANKVKGIRCGIGYNDDVTRLLRQHNNANMISFGEGFTTEKDALRRVDIFLNTKFEGGRHEIRVAMMDKIC